MNLSTITCIYAPSGFLNMYHQNGRMIMNSLNMSNNTCTYYSALCFGSSAKTGEISALASYSSFVNNTASSSDCCLKFDRNSADCNHKMQPCNVISNKQSTNNYGLISSNSALTISNTCILNNEATLVIAVYNNYQMTLINTLLDDVNAKTGTFVIRDGPVTSFVNALVMYETKKCIVSFDSFEILTAAISKQRKTFCYKSPCHVRRGYVSLKIILVIQCCLL